MKFIIFTVLLFIEFDFAIVNGKLRKTRETDSVIKTLDKTEGNQLKNPSYIKANLISCDLKEKGVQFGNVVCGRYLNFVIAENATFDCYSRNLPIKYFTYRTVDSIQTAIDHYGFLPQQTYEDLTIISREQVYGIECQRFKE